MSSFHSARKRLLLVEDSVKDQSAFSRVVSEYRIQNPLVKFDLMFARDGEEALIKIFTDEPSLIILDMNLPKISGQEILERVSNSNLKHIPILVFTSSDVHSFVKDAYTNQCNVYFVKPSDYVSYFATVYGILDLALSKAKLPS